MNFTFFDHRDNYKRRKNLEWVASLLWKQWGLPLEINKRDDILYKGQKVGILWGLIKGASLCCNVSLGYHGNTVAELIV